MKTTFKVMTIAIALLATGVSASLAQDYQMGLAAAKSGDFATALREWKPLAEQGIAKAQFGLGLMYYQGQGVIQDNVYAHMWFNIAASTGDEKAIVNRDFI